MKKSLIIAALAAMMAVGAQAQDVVTVKDANSMTAKELERAAKLQKDRDKATKALEKAKSAFSKAEDKYKKAQDAADKAKKALEKAENKLKDAQKDFDKLNSTPLVKD